ncbi:putative immunoglobulin-blocking virulence protein [Mycoplasmopsis alligatoris]|uniref:Membrane family protein n=1 Tax=Mycoplasmopsis alligatoris A21JP2 TaxID=747682 RepID=D4XVD1_9BACT|nr:putative immunoglobulin-blocking virulence protein [Mycoplasmopsis alligatoris]EFF41707.1 membrane family protein [Mycoplasmopsis alligatoris A21JP2]
MIKAKKKRLIIIASVVAGAAIIPQAIGIPFYLRQLSNKLDVTTIARHIPENSIIKDGKVDTLNSISNIDNHLELLKKDEVVKPVVPKVDPHANHIITSITPTPQPVEEKPKPDEEVSIVAAPEEKKEEEKVNKDPVEGEKLEKAEDPKPKEVTITVDGIELNATIREQPERTKYKSDIENKIANRVEYINDITPDLLNVVVTEPFVAKTLGAARDRVSGDFIRIASVFKTPESRLFNAQEWFKVNGNPMAEYNFNLLKKNLLDKPNIADFLKDEERPKLKEMREKYKDENKKFQFYGWLIDSIDWRKIPLSPRAKAELAKGNIIEPSESYVNENGEIDSRVTGPIPGFNKTTNRMARDNKEKRVFGYKSWYTRSPDSLYAGTFENWTKTSANTEFKTIIPNNEEYGINFFRLTNTDPDFQKHNNGLVVEIDVANPKGYAKTVELINTLKKNGTKVTSYRIFNMGSKDGNQAFIPIMEALPDVLPQLELFFESTSTSSLIKLENKKIDELGLYTSGNSLLPDWSINPFALRNVAYVNTLDYNVSSDYRPGTRVPTRITFDAVAFDKQNYKPGTSDPYSEINLGLRMALFTRNNEPFFQGGFGPGLKPDHNEGGNSYPTGLDLSRIPEMKSLKGLQYSFIKDGKQFDRKVRKLILYSDTPNFEISVQEMIDSQFHKVMFIPGPPNPGEERLKFVGASVKNIYLSGSGTLKDEGASNLETFVKQVGRTYFNTNTKILVDPNNAALLKQLQGMGYNAHYITKDDSLKIN